MNVIVPTSCTVNTVSAEAKLFVDRNKVEEKAQDKYWDISSRGLSRRCKDLFGDSFLGSTCEWPQDPAALLLAFHH